MKLIVKVEKHGITIPIERLQGINEDDLEQMHRMQSKAKQKLQKLEDEKKKKNNELASKRKENRLFRTYSFPLAAPYIFCYRGV